MTGSDGGPYGVSTRVLLGAVEQRVEPGSADDADIGQYGHAQTLTARLVASYGARHGVDRDARRPAMAAVDWRCSRIRMAGEPELTEGRAMESLVGQLLVATPALRDPNFERTVVLLVAHEDGGALGVVLNRATEVPGRRGARRLGRAGRRAGGRLRGRPGAARGGDLPGPGPRPAPASMRGFSRVEGTVGTVDLSGDPDRMRDELIEVRVFAGYAGLVAGPARGGDRDRLVVRLRRAARRRLHRAARTTCGRWCCAARAACTAAVALYPADPTLN